jgi:hypothetical protein
MPQLTDLTGLAGIASVIAACVLLLPRVKQLPKRYLAMLTAAVFIASLIPFGGLPLAGYVRGMVGDLSITTVVLAWAVLLHPYCAETKKKSRAPLLILISAAALFLYPMTLGMSLYDPYRLGYSDIFFVGLVLIIAVVAWLLRYTAIALCLALATLAWSLGWYESTNLWDYLLDPLVAIYAMSALILRKTNLRLFGAS